MIKKIRIRNYKCYGDMPSDFDLAHINFIYGDNSVGKSTFLQCLSRIWDTYNGGDDSVPSSEEFDRLSFKGCGADKIDVRLKTGRDEVWQFASVDGKFALRDVNGKIVSKDEWLAEVPFKSHVEAPRANRLHDSGSALSKLVEDSFDIDSVNGMFERLEISYRCAGKSFALDDLMLDREDLPLKDIGTGIVGIFEVLKKISNWKSGMLLLEEPEANVNERQIQPLTQILVDEAKKRSEAGGQLFVECHSELMMLELRNLLNHGVLLPEELAVFVVTKSQDGSIVKKIPFDKFGNIQKSWPGGFFPARVKIADAYYDDKGIVK